MPISGALERRRGMRDDAMAIRPVARLAKGVPASDGAGVKLTRVIGNHDLPDVDPFLLLDEIRSDEGADYVAGFPDHPHRGFETVTYVLAGRMRHGDNRGNSGLLTAGSLQWMTAGRGIVHSEMPEQENGLMWGFQLWVNLPAKDKMIAPRYQDIAPDRVPQVDLPGLVTARALAAGSSVTVPLPRGHNAFVYAFEGEATVGAPATQLSRGSAAVLGAGDVAVLGGGATGGRALLGAARAPGAGARCSRRRARSTSRWRATARS